MTTKYSHEVTVNTQDRKVLYVTKANGDKVWMLLTIDRKHWQCNDVCGKPGVSDEVNLKLRIMGSIDGGLRCGDVVMEMRGEASGVSESVRFSNGYIVVESPWEGLRIGTYMMNHLVSWATKNYPDYKAFGIKLIQCQAYEGNKERRNRFYEQFGFRFNWSTPDFSEGELVANMPICELNPVDPEKWGKTIVEYEFLRGMEKIFGDTHSLLLGQVSLEYKVRKLTDQNEYWKNALVTRLRAKKFAGWFRFGFGLLVGAVGMGYAQSYFS